MIDTAEKRRSAGGVAFLPLGPGVTPNSSKDQEWRQQSAWSYSGILAEGPSADPEDVALFETQMYATALLESEIQTTALLASRVQTTALFETEL